MGETELIYLLETNAQTKSQMGKFANVFQKKEAWIKFEPEDPHITNSRFEKLKTAEITCCTLASVGFVCGAMISDIGVSDVFINERNYAL